MIPPFGILAPGRILFGRGRAAEAAGLVAGIGSRAFVVHGKGATRADWLLAGLRSAAVGVQATACPGEPTLDGLEQALAEARAFAPDVVVALGGGAAIDLGKAVAALAAGTARPLDHLEIVGRGLPLATPPLPFVAIPTTSGTGAEATRNAVIGVPSHRRKVSLRDDRMLARLAIVDPALTDATPRDITLASGLDAITQVIEPYLCTRANPYTDVLCRPAIAAGLGALRSLMESESRQARDAMAWVSLSGGMALANSGLGAVHGLAGVIGGMVAAPHGALCGALLPHVLSLHASALSANAPQAGRVAEIRGWLGAAFGSDDGIAALERWMHDSGLPRISRMGVRAADHPAIARAAASSSSMKADPTQPDAEALSALLALAS
jgi:alcohol dehydrogenase class IV